MNQTIAGLSKRQEIESEFEIIRGVIMNPGKFQGCSVYVPYFWDIFMNGGGDCDEDGILTFKVWDEDRQLFPELNGNKKVRLFESDNGFVYEIR